jgi:hypothetical protein
MKKSELKQLIRECINEATTPAATTKNATLYERWIATRSEVGLTNKFLRSLGNALIVEMRKSGLEPDKKFRWMGAREDDYGARDCWLQIDDIKKDDEKPYGLQLTFDSKKKTLEVYVHPNGSQFGKDTDITNAVTVKDIVSGIEKSIEAIKSGAKPVAPKDDFDFS